MPTIERLTPEQVAALTDEELDKRLLLLTGWTHCGEYFLWTAPDKGRTVLPSMTPSYCTSGNSMLELLEWAHSTESGLTFQQLSPVIGAFNSWAIQRTHPNLNSASRVPDSLPRVVAEAVYLAAQERE